MLVVGITGQSGAGKGEVSRLLCGYGIICLDTDKTAREVVAPGSPCLSELVAHFGEGILLSSGEMDRKKVASLVFSNKSELEFLTRVTHRYIIEEIKEWLFRRELDGEKIVAIDAPQLFDAGADFYCNFIVGVLSEENSRISRIISRDKISKEEAEKRISSQESDEFFISRCDYIVRNDGDLCELERQVENLYKILISKKEYYED